MPRICPLLGSIATAAPLSSPSASLAAFWTSGSIVVTTSPGAARFPVITPSGLFSRSSVPSSTWLYTPSSRVEPYACEL